MCVFMGWRIKNPNDVWLCSEREKLGLGFW